MAATRSSITARLAAVKVGDRVAVTLATSTGREVIEGEVVGHAHAILRIRTLATTIGVSTMEGFLVGIRAVA